MSIAPSGSPSSRWSCGSKSNVGGVPTVSQDDVVVLAAGGRALLDEVRHGADELRQLLVEPLRLGLGLLDLLRQLLRAVEQRLALVTLRAGDRLADRLLLGAARLERTERGSPPLVQVEQLLDDGVVLAACTLARAQPVRVGS